MTISTATYEQRRENVRKRLKDRGLPPLLVSFAANRYYLSGFELHDPQCNETAGWLVISPEGRDFLLTDPRYLDAARRDWNEDDIFIYSGRKYDALKDFFKSNSISALAYDPKSINIFEHEKLTDLCELQPVTGLVEDLRLIKDEAEIKIMEESCALNHKVYELLQPKLQEGKTEAEISWEVEQLFRNNGATGLSFPTIVGVGPNAALPHAIPGNDKLKENDLVLIDMGGRLGDYCSDQTRTFWIGDKPSDRFLTVKEQVQEAQMAAIKVLRPGLPIQHAYHTAKAVFEKYGVEKYFTHSLGHGIGLETHEQPSVSPVAIGELKPGMVITVEPGLYYPDWGGIRWEYMVLITEDGYKIM
ncbi:M24 family metallopeptidase [Maridesulfovibrio hydrothermalis]|uniref:Peptidase M24 n=1 Tax=Maridesulfovibrio hydrothermalis AM13 = DSM 14728 TaxID=1121451 RepID=L0RAT3_9BACT|nr:aminopeptidase P family protein [Maridesulfovibrio hydrothermalis]CCO23327.1 Peptidase M24 [Maridesulfovibrio hydrothermalis AM13 = DSM 14728]